uniref:Uncharacterized protein n=1 Tax=Arundo donax TaxID=35708 RepID=A0A0A9GIK3_ARUDO
MILCRQPLSRSDLQMAVAWLHVSTQATQSMTCGHSSMEQGQRPVITRCRPGSPLSRSTMRTRLSRKLAWLTR